ncbi:hypothetical protein HBH98_006150 [Parastagonospora nodorum]|nr:hypothetical protein HBH52_204300 [Parastagonospora nodorum]KAH3971224.1 hypothetical protein HBH51_110010 [Parastagonospora nodorum]KAH4058091.1 hypothetical protein HBH49_028610 [Parastagonospora nodorum]KAH4063498.1 hypothetical protein HBH50_190610 [Parastagonospora nodorum]KAH4083096.1 hypothetical protein HBH48_179350 [Parastagonospora nodorum]
MSSVIRHDCQTCDSIGYTAGIPTPQSPPGSFKMILLFNHIHISLSDERSRRGSPKRMLSASGLRIAIVRTFTSKQQA